MKKIAEAQREISQAQSHLSDALDKLYEDAKTQILKEDTNGNYNRNNEPDS